eukprot:754760-Hanusia_phi.AAC.2
MQSSRGMHCGSRTPAPGTNWKEEHVDAACDQRDVQCRQPIVLEVGDPFKVDVRLCDALGAARAKLIAGDPTGAEVGGRRRYTSPAVQAARHRLTTEGGWFVRGILSGVEAGGVSGEALAVSSLVPAVTSDRHDVCAGEVESRQLYTGVPASRDGAAEGIVRQILPEEHLDKASADVGKGSAVADMNRRQGSIGAELLGGGGTEGVGVAGGTAVGELGGGGGGGGAVEPCFAAWRRPAAQAHRSAVTAIPAGRRKSSYAVAAWPWDEEAAL